MLGQESAELPHHESGLSQGSFEFSLHDYFLELMTQDCNQQELTSVILSCCSW